MALTQSTRIATLNTPLGGDTLVFHSLSISEELGRLFSLDIEAGSERGDLKADDLLGKSVSVEMQCPRGGVRYFHGFVSRLSRIPRPGTRYFAYRLTAVPWLWFLTRHSDCRIFQNKTLQDILRDVFGRHGFSDFKFQLSGNYTPWEYCVQYRETDFNFVSRLLEQEGVYYYFEHEKEKHTAVFADSPAAHQPFPKYERLTFSALTSIHEHDQEHVYEWVAESRHHSGKYQQTDYDFTKPTVDLRTPESNPGNFAHSDFEIFDYPGGYEQRSDGEQWSRVRMEELRADRETFQGAGDVTGLATGCKFTLSKGPGPADAGDYLVIANSVRLESNIYESGTSGGMGETYHCIFTAIKAADQFRSARLTPKPVIQGVQTAVVTGPKGEKIHTDKYGRMKVRFHWDRHGKGDDNSSCWIRVSQPWGGKNWGGMFIAHVGQEVVVSFEEGDPDRPLITGRVYNADQMPPLGLPANKTKSAIRDHGGNEIVIEGAAGKQQIRLFSPHANTKISLGAPNQANLHIETDGHSKVTIGEDEERRIKGICKEVIEKDRAEETKGKSEYHWGGGKFEVCHSSVQEVYMASLTKQIWLNFFESVLGICTESVVGYRLEHLIGGEKSLVNGKVHKTPTLKELIEKHIKWINEETTKAKIKKEITSMMHEMKANELLLDSKRNVFKAKQKEYHEAAKVEFAQATTVLFESKQIEQNASASIKLLSDLIKIG